MRRIPTAHPTQTDAIRHPEVRLFIEAGPGTGKTFVVAERFGYLAFRRGETSPKVLSLSFTVSATSVLKRALRARWGRQAVEFPHCVQTFDSLFRDLLEYLLRSGLIEWPGGHLAIDPIDEWDDRQPAPAPNPVSWEPVLDGMTVTADRRFVDVGEYVVTAKKRLLPQLEKGCCTHDGIRSIVVTAASEPALRERIVHFLRGCATTVIVDELFDANATDVELLALLLDAGCSMTAVGDPWQALYDFRLSAPVDVRDELLIRHGFEQVPLKISFRFEPGTEAERVAALARTGSACAPLVVVDEPDVVLAAEWSHLWDTGPEVLPMAFGQVRSQVDALMTLLLDDVVRARGFAGSRFAGAALSRLGIDLDLHMRFEAFTLAVAPVIALLDSDEVDVEAVLQALSLIPKEHFGAGRKVSVTSDVMERCGPLIRALSERLKYPGQQVPGLTVHQAKGREWDRVAVVLSSEDEHALTAALDIDNADHRRLYVALTRGRNESGRYA